MLPGAGLKNRRLERRAIMQKWNVPEDKLPTLIDRQIKDATDPEVPTREATQAFLAVLKARQQDLEIEKMETGTDEPSHQTNIQVNVNTVQSALTEPAYLEYLRSRALENDSDPSPVRANGKPGAVENGPASGGYRPGTNGRHSEG